VFFQHLSSMKARLKFSCELIEVKIIDDGLELSE